MTRPDATQILSILTSLVGTISFSCLFVAIVTDHWLYTLEKTPDLNGTFVIEATRSGLWKKCPQDPTTSLSTCFYINYFDPIDRDGLGSTESILLSLRRATVFPLLSVTVSLAGQIFCYISNCHSGPTFRSIATFTAGVLFIVSGLSLFVGFIIYIGAVTEEAANRSKSKDDPTFVYSYGPSLLLIVASFFASEMAGVMAIHLFISLRRQIHTTDKHLQRPSVDQCSANDASSASAQPPTDKPAAPGAAGAAGAAARLLRYPTTAKEDASAWTIDAPATAAAITTASSAAVVYSDTACSTPCRRSYPFYPSPWKGEFKEPPSNGHTGSNWVEDDDPHSHRRITPV